MNAVQLHIIIVSVKTPKDWIKPCFTGWVTCAVAAALGALPIPASLENRPLFTPVITTPINVPIAIPLKSNALSTINAITLGISVIFITTIAKATNIYNPANTGTIISETFATLCTPPKITIAVKIPRPIPIAILLIPNALLNASETVFAWTALNTKP